MKKKSFLLLVSIGLFALVQLACEFITSPATEVPPLQPAEPVAAPGAAQGAQNQAPQETEFEPAAQAEGCPALPAAQTSPTGLVSEVVLAMNVEEETMAPVEPIRIYGRQDIFHAVVHIENAPSNARFRVVWYATDVGEGAPCNTRIDAHEITADGTRYIDFNLTPDSPWPTGSYRAEVFCNDNLEQVIEFTVQ